MRELDVLLTAYIDAHCGSLNEEQWLTFEALLAESDMDLYAWFTGRSTPADPAYGTLVSTIRAASQP